MSIERHSVHQILQGTGQTLSVQFYQGGTVKDPGTVTVTITNADGTALVTDGATSGSGTNPRTYTLTPAQTANLTTFTAVWTTDDSGDLADGTSVTTYAEVVGDLPFTIAEARTFHRDELQDTSKYPDGMLIQARYQVAQMVEDIIGYPLGRRYQRDVFDGDGTRDLLIHRMHVVDPVRSVEYREYGATTWTAFTADERADVLVYPSGRLVRESLGTWPKGMRNVRVGYEWGLNNYPLELREAALKLAVDSAVPSDISERAMSYSDGLMTVRYVTPGLTRGAFTSLPGVNEALGRLSMRVQGVG